jgi:iron-sulfur cluster insertion protein
MDISVTDGAAAKLVELLSAEPEGTALRIYVQGGGCSGFQYGFQFETEFAEDDTTFEVKGVRLVIDSMSYCYLAGAVLDFKGDAFGSAFTLVNPNAKSTCGCGASFSAG